MSKRPLAVALVMVAVVTGLFGWRQLRGAPSPALATLPTNVSAFEIKPHSVANTLRAVGALQAVQGVTLSPEQPGRVIAIRYEAGQNVKAGTPLVPALRWT